MVDENIMYQQLQKFCRGKFVQKSFSCKFGKIREKYSSHPQKISCSYTYDKGVWGTKSFLICCAACANGVHLFWSASYLFWINDLNRF